MSGPQRKRQSYKTRGETFEAVVDRPEQVQGLLLRSGADFEARGRWSMDGADLKALEVFGKCSTTEKAVVQDPGGDF